MERGRLKCHKYWPDLDEDEQVSGINGEFRIRTVKEENRGEYLVRTFEMEKKPKENDEPCIREIYHYQFLGWEDQSCPSGLLINYLEEVNVCAKNKCPSDMGPIVAHCSAGIGRTGTFIVLDILLAKIKQQGPNCVIDIFKTVRMCREQRATMVQTEAQYRFIYEAVSNYIRRYRKGSSCSSSKKHSMNGRRSMRNLEIEDDY